MKIKDLGRPDTFGTSKAVAVRLGVRLATASPHQAISHGLVREASGRERIPPPDALPFQFPCKAFMRSALSAILSAVLVFENSGNGLCVAHAST